MNPYEKNKIKEIIEDYFHDETLELNLQFTRKSKEEAEKLVSLLSRQLEVEYEYAEHKGFEWFFITITPDVLLEVNVLSQENKKEPTNE